MNVRLAAVDTQPLPDCRDGHNIALRAICCCSPYILQLAQSVQAQLDSLPRLGLTGTPEEADLRSLLAAAAAWEADVTATFTSEGAATSASDADATSTGTGTDIASVNAAAVEPSESKVQELHAAGEGVLAAPLLFQAVRWRVDCAAYSAQVHMRYLLVSCISFISSHLVSYA